MAFYDLIPHKSEDLMRDRSGDHSPTRPWIEDGFERYTRRNDRRIEEEEAAAAAAAEGNTSEWEGQEEQEEQGKQEVKKEEEEKDEEERALADRLLRLKHVSEGLTVLIKEIAAREYSARFSLRRTPVDCKKYVCYVLNRITAGGCPQCKCHHKKGSTVKVFLSASGYTPLAGSTAASTI